jgi:hypothetical protein
MACIGGGAFAKRRAALSVACCGCAALKKSGETCRALVLRLSNWKAARLGRSALLQWEAEFVSRNRR